MRQRIHPVVMIWSLIFGLPLLAIGVMLCGFCLFPFGRERTETANGPEQARQWMQGTLATFWSDPPIRDDEVVDVQSARRSGFRSADYWIRVQVHSADMQAIIDRIKKVDRYVEDADVGEGATCTFDRSLDEFAPDWWNPPAGMLCISVGCGKWHRVFSIDEAHGVIYIKQ